MAIDLSGIASWLHGWFPYHSEVVAKDQTNANASKNVVTDSSGQVTTENKVSVGSNSGLSMSNTNVISHSNSVTGGELTTSTLKKVKYDGQGHITETTNPNTTDLPNSENYTNLGNNLSNQKLINDAINSKIGDLSSIKAIEVVSTLPPASSSTMGKLYIISENSKINVYYTEQSGTGSSATYSWHKMDADILDELSIDWSEIDNNPFSSSTPSSFANATHPHTKSDITDFSHKHGSITNDGKVGSTPNKPLITTTGGEVTTGSFGTSANTFCQGNDSRLSDARTPTSHSHGSIRSDGTLYQYSNKIVVTNGMSYIIGVDYLGASQIRDLTTGGYSNIGSSQNATQETINGLIDTALGNKANSTDIPTDVSDLTDTNDTAFTPKSHLHGQITDDGKITSNLVTVDGMDSIVITDYSDSNKIKRVGYLLAGMIIDTVAHSHIGSDANDSQLLINSAIDTAIENLQSSTITSISLVPKSTDANGKIIFYTGDEPS